LFALQWLAELKHVANATDLSDTIHDSSLLQLSESAWRRTSHKLASQLHFWRQTERQEIENEHGSVYSNGENERSSEASKNSTTDIARKHCLTPRKLLDALVLADAEQVIQNVQKGYNGGGAFGKTPHFTALHAARACLLSLSRQVR
jgi:hypothetical protein